MFSRYRLFMNPESEVFEEWVIAEPDELDRVKCKVIYTSGTAINFTTRMFSEQVYIKVLSGEGILYTSVLEAGNVEVPFIRYQEIDVECGFLVNPFQPFYFVPLTDELVIEFTISLTDLENCEINIDKRYDEAMIRFSQELIRKASVIFILPVLDQIIAKKSQ